jgi:RNA polymerase sigma factor (TIGR02999 family)
MSTEADVSALMARFRAGDTGSAEELVRIFYADLRRLAASKMRSESPDHTLQPTALVNELFLELVKIKKLVLSERDSGSEKADFMALAAFLMRRILIHHARPLSYQATTVAPEFDRWVSSTESNLREVEDVLERLGAIDPNLRTVVELKVFEGLTTEELAERMGCSPRSVVRYWTFARNWLHTNLA